MSGTILLSKVLGLYISAVCLAVLLRRDAFVELVGKFARDRSLRAIFSGLGLLGGLFLVTLHRAWSPAPAFIVSLLGWMAVLECLAYLLLPERAVQSFLAAFEKPGPLVALGAAGLLLGLYLAASGFGWL